MVVDVQPLCVILMVRVMPLPVTVTFPVRFELEVFAVAEIDKVPLLDPLAGEMLIHD